MGKPLCRLGDIGVGVCAVCRSAQTGKIQNGAATVTVGGIPVARAGDMVVAQCGHIGIIQTACSLIIEGKFAARVGDPFFGDFSGKLVVGSNNVTA